jgi:TrmH family RNA methyltransferase
VLTSLKNPWVRQLRKLHQAKYRRQLQQFLLEGTHLVQEAIATQYQLQSVGATPTWIEAHPDVWEQLQTPAEEAPFCQVVSPEVLAAIATTVTPDGVVASAPLLPPPQLESIPQLAIAVENLQDPGNAGSLIRTAAAANCDGLWFSADSVDLTHPRVLRASAGQWFRMAKYVASELVMELVTLQSQGCQILATAATGTIPYWEIDLTQPTVLLLGNEGQGLSTTALAIADQVVTIPMSPRVESLNVGIAAAIILFEAQRQRQASSGSLSMG